MSCGRGQNAARLSIDWSDSGLPMQCPYCGESIKDGAILCKHCHQVLLSLNKPLIEHHQQLEAQVSELQAELARMKAVMPQPSGISNDSKSTQSAAPDLLPYCTYFVLFPILLLLLAHYLIVVRLDLKVIDLRIVSMLIPLLFGVAMFRQTQQMVGSFIIVGVVGLITAVTAVIGMSVVMHLVYGYPIIPSTQRDLQEDLEYAVSMMLATISGYSLASILQYNGDRPEPAKWAGSNVERHTSIKRFSEHIDTVERFMRVLTAIFAAVGSVYIGLRGILS
jgi:hypothetical protein